MKQLFELKEIPLSDIIVSDRARLDYGDMTELQHDITEHGLLYPILVDENHKLIDGGRRLKAHEGLELASITCRILPGITADNAKILERISNVARKSFAWHEELGIKHDLHSMWKKENHKWSYRDTSKRLGCSIGGLSSDLALMEAITTFPELKDYKKKSQARDAYKKMQDHAVAVTAIEGLSEQEHKNLQAMLSGNTDVAATIAPSIPSATHSEVPIERIIEGEAPVVAKPPEEPTAVLPTHVYEVSSNRDFIPKIPDGTVGFVEIDPLYAIDFNNTYGGLAKTKPTEDDWTFEQLVESMTWMLPELYKKLLDNSFMLCWTGKEHFTWINKLAHEAGFSVQDPGVWIKDGGSSNTPKTNMISMYEMFLILRKGKAVFNTPSFPGVIHNPTLPASQRGHQWEKPIDLYTKFMEAMGKPGTIFLSPFAGSGNSMIASAKIGMTPMGCDVKQKYAYQFFANFKKEFGGKA
jgi:hypothetical protein